MENEIPTTSGYATEADYNKLEHFRRHYLGPPAGHYVTVDDIILVRGWSISGAVTIQVALRMLAPNGEIIPVFQQLNILANGNTPTQLLIRNLEGFILSATVTATNVQRGVCFVALLVQRGAGSGDATLGHQFLAGYPSTFDVVGYPQSPARSSLHGRGALTVTAVGNPAAGADWSTILPTGQQQVIRSVAALFTPSAAVANRFPVLEIEDPVAHFVSYLPVVAAIPASTATFLTWAPGLNPISTNGVQTMGLPEEFRVAGSWTVKTLTAGIQAADQWSAIVLFTESFAAQ